jgi:hypothetical protein
VSRPQFRSRPGAEVHAPDVYEILESHEKSIKNLEGLAQDGKLADAQILTKLTGLEATDRHATTKMIAALVVTVITTIGSVVGTIAAMRPNAQPTAPAQRSELDKKLDTCRGMAPGPGRSECFARVVAESEP